MVEEEEEVEEEERGVSGQPGSSRATRRNPLSHPPSYPPSLSSRRPCQPPVLLLRLLLLLILFLFHVLSKPLPTSTTFASFLPAGGGGGHPSGQPFTHTRRGASPSSFSSTLPYTARDLSPAFTPPSPPPPFRRWSAPIYFEPIARISRLVIDSRRGTSPWFRSWFAFRGNVWRSGCKVRRNLGVEEVLRE